MIEWILGGIILIAVLALIAIYNSFISLRNRMNNAFAQIDVQTKRRYDLVPNLVESVKGYMKHEKGVLESVTKARAAIVTGASVKDRLKAEGALTNALKSLFAVAESYPDLKANQNFLMLQEELSGIESKIAFARQFYNDSVMKWNQNVQMFPNSLVANLFKFQPQEFLEATAEERKAVKVKF
ncbi:MAG: LemA family protein [Candidatus Aenigmatarchaeota archaeon]